MRRFILSLISAVLFATATTPPAHAVEVDDLLLHMGIKIEYVWKDPTPLDEGNLEAGNPTVSSPGYTFTTKDTPELIAQALSNNHPSVSAGFIRQLPARDILKLLIGIKSAADILVERGREDLLALAYIGGYIAPERELVAISAGDGASTYVPAENNTQDVPAWAKSGDIGQVGTYAAVPLLGDIRLRSVFGESYTLGTTSFGMDETVFDTPKGADIRALFNGYVAVNGSGILEIRSYDQRLVVRYSGLGETESTLVGRVVTQGEIIGKTSGFALGVSLKIDGVSRNILQIYTEPISKQWFDAWEVKHPGQKDRLVLGKGDTHYHIAARRLSKTDPNSYTNPEAYGVDPKTIIPE